MSDRYILDSDGRTPVQCEDLLEWANWLEKNERSVKKTTVGDSDVSTVFLGLDHQFGNGRPILFETLVFDGRLDGEMDRYSTWDEAEAGHEEMVKRVRDAADRAYNLEPTT